MKKTKTKFGRFMKKYCIILGMFIIVFLGYVMNTLYQYEASFTDNYMDKYVKTISESASNGKIQKICDVKNITVNDLDNNKSDSKKAIEQALKSSNLTYKLSSKKNAQEPVYGVYANDQKVMDVTLQVKKQHHRLGLFTYPSWEVKDCKLSSERGIYYFDVLVPNNYSVTVNGTKLDDKYISDSVTDENYNILAKYVDLPKLVNYKLDNFISKPDIKIANEKGENVDYSINNHKVEINNLYQKVDSYDEAKKILVEEIDALDIAKKWSLFLTDDLQGNKHGFSVLNQYLVKDTSLYDMAYKWATSIDITFTSKHTLKNPTFTNTKVSNFEIYGKNAFSCTVYLEKNMVIANGNDKVDVMHDKLYFVYYDDTNDGKDNPRWKWDDMKAVTEK